MICFDLEGPLSPQDNAYEVMKLAKNGGTVFEALSKYDDILALKGRTGYEPGDTLKLIVPFLIYYGITEQDIKTVSERAVLVEGMKETVDWLRGEGIPVRIISTSYQQHAHSVGERLGVSKDDIASTLLDFKSILLDGRVIESLKKIEEKILSDGLTDESTAMLDNLYFSSGLFDMVGVEVVGGQRKVRALLAFAKEAGLEVKDVVAVGDSITDFKMLGEVSKRGGLSIAFNANEYCLPYADVGVASADGRAVLPVIAEFLRSGREGAVKKVEELSRDLSGLERRFKYLKELEPEPHYCSPQKGGTEFEDLLKAHKKMRLKVRGEAGKLG